MAVYERSTQFPIVMAADPHHQCSMPSLSSPGLDSPGGRKNKPRPVEVLFPTKLYEMLAKVELMSDLVAAVSWLPHGRAFRVNDKVLFMEEVMPRFFKATKLRSFHRQLHLWGFTRIPTGSDAGSWWHDSFIRGHPEDLKLIVRTRVKGKASTMFQPQPPDFYNIISPKVCKSEEVNYVSCKKGSGDANSKAATHVKTVSASGSDTDLSKDLDDEIGYLFEDAPLARRVSCFASPDMSDTYTDVGADSMPVIPAMNLSSDHQGLSFQLKKKEANYNHYEASNSNCLIPADGSGVASSKMNQQRNFYESRSFIPSSVHVQNICVPDASLSNPSPPVPSPLSMGSSCGDLSPTQDNGVNDDALDEFSIFIDRMIQFPLALDGTQHD